jgi:hypothetical protein
VDEMNPNIMDVMVKDRINALENDGIGQRALARAASSAPTSPAKPRVESRSTISFVWRLIRREIPA